MSEDQKKNTQGNPEGGGFDDSPLPGEDPRPISLRPQEMPRAEGKPLPPRPREQALPEKDDDRFFDRWVVDKARILGGRAVRQPAAERLMKTVRTFAEWRSLRHGPAAEQESLSDRALVASTPEKIKNLEAEATQLTAEADETEQEAVQLRRDVEEAADGLAELRPALRGSRSDFRLLMLANLVVFGVDFYIIQVALKTIPGTAQQHRLTALMLGAGAVVVGDVLGWMAAAGTFQRDGGVQRPRPETIVSVASLLILAVLFFGLLGDFREEGLNAAKDQGPDFGDPTFFTIAQILFLIGSAVVSFAYVGRRTGRELRASHQIALAKHQELKSEVSSLRGKAAEARQAAAEAPALRLAAEERIRSRERIADGNAKHDLKQGEYLESLVIPEYMRERAAVESGIYRWQFDERRQRDLILLGPVSAIAATLAAGGLAYLGTKDALISILIGLIIAGALALVLAWRNAEDLEGGHSWKYVAQLIPTARKDSERATDIERLVPVEDTDTAQNGSDNGNGRGKRQTRAELMERIERAKEVLGDEAE